MLASRTQLRTSSARPTVAARPARVSTVTRAALEPSLVISATTVVFLSLGRFVFLPYQRKSAAWAQDSVGPKTTGTTFFDNLQKPAAFTLQSKDPSGFGLVDVFGWGALGHAVAFGILAASSLNDAGVSAFPR